MTTATPITIETRPLAYFRAHAEPHPARVDLNSFRAGWILWCYLRGDEDCKNGAELMGYQYAAEYNDNGGGARPSAEDAQDLDASDIKQAIEWL